MRRRVGTQQPGDHSVSEEDAAGCAAREFLSAPARTVGESCSQLLLACRWRSAAHRRASASVGSCRLRGRLIIARIPLVQGGQLPVVVLLAIRIPVPVGASIQTTRSWASLRTDPHHNKGDAKQKRGNVASGPSDGSTGLLIGKQCGIVDLAEAINPGRSRSPMTSRRCRKV